ncbi:MAG TPA: hypothetical protein VLT62_10235 [Candidatus Methylomirabilis sp.]|nr:hypothetical protein [Candidatus Methylomirabilis sp.]
MTPVKPSQLPSIARSAALAAAVLLGPSLATTASGAPPPALARDYSLRVDYATQSYEDALLTVRNRLLEELKTARAFPPGYPKPCRFRVAPLQGPGATPAVTPYRSEITDPGAHGLLLDAEGHYVMLGVLDAPDPRPSLFDIFLVGDSEVLALERSARDTLPRIVVQAPVLGDARYPALVELLAKGLRGAGAQEISFKWRQPSSGAISAFHP